MKMLSGDGGLAILSNLGIQASGYIFYLIVHSLVKMYQNKTEATTNFNIIKLIQLLL